MGTYIKLQKRIGGIDFEAKVPRPDTKTDAVEGRVLIAVERWIMGNLCRFGSPSADGFQFLRTRSQLKAADLATLIDVTPETISRWENGRNEVPGSAWELIVILAEEYLEGRADTLDQLRRRHQRRRDPPRRLSMKPEDLAVSTA